MAYMPRRGGTTRGWATLRRAVLERAGWACEIVVSDGSRCGRPAVVCGHITPYAMGGANVLENLRAECRKHSDSEGGRLVHALGHGNAAASMPVRVQLW